jgi:hypothetical protein
LFDSLQTLGLMLTSLLRRLTPGRECEPQTQRPTQRATKRSRRPILRRSLSLVFVGLLGIWLETGGKILVRVNAHLLQSLSESLFRINLQIVPAPPDCPQSLLAIKDHTTIPKGMQEKFFQNFS